MPMSRIPQQRYTTAEYLSLERTSDVRHEFVDGQIVAMSGGSIWHAIICDNMLVRLTSRLEGSGCKPFSASLRVKIQATGNYTYPDLSIVCGERQMEDGRNDTLLNPKVLVEVLSPSTESHVRGWKFRNYQLIPSFEEFLLVSQDEPRVERFRRQGEVGWLMTHVSGLDQTVRIESIGCELPLREIYKEVVFGQEPA
jgi:Uma2 family endonuclease